MSATNKMKTKLNSTEEEKRTIKLWIMHDNGIGIEGERKEGKHPVFTCYQANCTGKLLFQFIFCLLCLRFGAIIISENMILMQEL